MQVLLLHGALASATQVEPLRHALDGGHRAVAVDLPGHGRDGRVEDFTLDGFVAHALTWLQEGEPAVVFGYSMGGYVALELARRHPERVAAVVTLATKLSWSPEVAAREVARLDPAVLEAKAPAFAASLQSIHTGSGWRSVLARTAEFLTWLGGAAPLTEVTLAEIAAPVRLVVGDRDALVSVEECLAAVRALPAGELEVLPATGHPFERVPVARLVGSVSDVLAAEVRDRP